MKPSLQSVSELLFSCFSFAGAKIVNKKSSILRIGIGCGIALSIPFALAESQDKIPEPVTKRWIPTKLELPSLAPQETWNLLGMGPRQVTFFRFNVYAMAIYLPETVSSALFLRKEWKDFDKNAFVEKDMHVDSLLKLPLCLRIEPVRNTNGAHLRDGFAKYLIERLGSSEMSQVQREQKLEAIIDFKSAFPKSNVQSGECFLFYIYDEKLVMEHNGNTVGQFSDAWLRDNFFVPYLKGNVISRKTKESVGEGLATLAKK